MVKMIILKIDNIKLPRVNAKYFKNFSLRPEYRDGKNFLTRCLKEQTEGLPKVKPPYSIIINVGTHFDIDSFVKPTLDSMQDAKVIDNDKNVLHLEIYKTPLKRNEANWIEIHMETVQP